MQHNTKEVSVVGIMSLWLPIVVAAALVFVVSSVIHMLLPYHRNDFRAVPGEAEVMAALRPFNLPPGDYMMPRAANVEEMRSAAFAEKLKQGPVMTMTVHPNGPFSMGPSLALWFAYSIVVGIFAAYVAGRALGPGAEYLAVFRFAGVTAFLGYSMAMVQASIWMRRSWATTAKSMFDGLIYALLTGGAFGWLWPN